MSSAAEPAAGEHKKICALGHVHWGANGGAERLLRYAPARSEPASRRLFLADVEEMFDAYSVLETGATGWFTTQKTRTLPLHSGVLHWLDDVMPTEP
jgi:hypothetical protein